MLEEIITYISAYQHMPKEHIHKNTHLIKDLGMSSIDAIQLVCAMEEHFQIEFEGNDLLGLLTVEAIADYLECKLAQ